VHTEENEEIEEKIEIKSNKKCESNLSNKNMDDMILKMK